MAASIEDEYRRICASGWTAEFEKIVETCKKYNYTFVEAKKPENTIYNRYMDICPFDHSRVILKKSQSDYINANTVRVDKANKRYILTQGPTASSTPHFWRMVWEHGCKAIIMLNKRIENDRVKCSLYWPANVGEEHALNFDGVGLRVQQLTDECHSYYSTRIMRVTDTETQETREVIQFHYTTWPDFGVPSSPTAFLDFLYAVRASGAMDPDVGPPVVHCSAGVGRSGTFCLVDSCLLMIEKYGADDVNVREALLEMRKYRMGLIQTPDQLRFSYQAIIKGAHDMLEPGEYKQNGSENIYDIPKEDSGDAPPVPPPRAASLKVNSNDNQDSSDENNDSDDNSDSENEKDTTVPNGVESAHDYQPPMKDLPEVPSDSNEEDGEVDEVSIHENSNDSHEAERSVLEGDGKTADSVEDKDGVRRRRLLSEKSAKLQERVQEMKRKQQKAEEYQKKKRSLYIPMIIGLGIAIFAVSYISLKN